MAAAAEPRPASLPLPGGRDGATVRVHPVTTGTMMWPDAAMWRTSGRLRSVRALGIGSGKTRIPIPAYIVEHPGAGTFLVDAGFHGSVAADKKANLGRLGAIFTDVDIAADEALPGQLRKRGIDPASIGLVVMTHLHPDHASGVSQFPDATFVVSEAEWEAASSGGLTDGYIRRQFDHAFDWRTVRFDGDDVSSFATFGRSLDLFGDGSVRLLSTPGHSRGHMSVVLRLPDREFLIAADAAFTLRALTEGVLPFNLVDEHEARRSLREIQLYRRETPQAVIVPGHDMGVWSELDPVYG